jgi:hypothetical protein
MVCGVSKSAFRTLTGSQCSDGPLELLDDQKETIKARHVGGAVIGFLCRVERNLYFSVVTGTRYGNALRPRHHLASSLRVHAQGMESCMLDSSHHPLTPSGFVTPKSFGALALATTRIKVPKDVCLSCLRSPKPM